MEHLAVIIGYICLVCASLGLLLLAIGWTMQQGRRLFLTHGNLARAQQTAEIASQLRVYAGWFKDDPDTVFLLDGIADNIADHVPLTEDPTDLYTRWKARRPPPRPHPAQIGSRTFTRATIEGSPTPAPQPVVSAPGASALEPQAPPPAAP